MLSLLGTIAGINQSSPEPGGLWTPAEITTALWLDASDNSTVFNQASGGDPCGNNESIKRWEDKSGTGRHAIAVSSQFPVYKNSIQNGLSVTRWNGGSSQVLQWGTAILTGSPYSFGAFIVQQTTGDRLLLTHSSLNHQARIGQSGGNTISAMAAGVSSTLSVARSSFSLVEYVRATSQLSYYESGNSKGTAAVFSNVEVTLNRIGPAFFGLTPNGDIAEVLVIWDSVNTEIRQRIEGYLAHKWGLAAQLPIAHPYKNNAPVI